ncbi:transmembrane signal receptor [Lithospermum erythrorhizon]|uniref:Transmembrane signal receptor n=1 Tax=Lithospermum erythrorhizon TaxID=34254 RepID=A0AAV3RVX9_LITER
MKKKLKCLSNFFLVAFFILFLCLQCNCEDESMEAPMEKWEQEALYSAIQGFVGKWWNGSDLYPDPCGWTPIQGVSCDLIDGLWHVTELRIGPIHDNSLKCAPNVVLTLYIFSLKHLKSLSFFNCFNSPFHQPFKIQTDMWEMLSGNLESLEFRSNSGLIGGIPETFGHLQKLQSLVLVENGLSGQLPTNLGNLVSLKRLVISGNKISGEIPSSFGGLKNLLILDLSRNALSGYLPYDLGGLHSLLKLDLSSNQLGGQIPEKMENLQNLTLLDMSNNRFSGGLTKSLQEMISLKELVLSNNPTGGDLKSIKWQNLIGLSILDLANMNLTGGIPDSISELKKLRFLGLNNNKLTGGISQKLAHLPNVSAIYLNGNNLTGELQFSEMFYGKMGRRFGAWNNSNLCYQVGFSSTKNVPFGVKPCGEEQVTIHETLINEKSHAITSLGCSTFGVEGLWFMVIVEIFIFELAFNL